MSAERPLPAALGLPERAAWRPLGGGSICAVFATQRGTGEDVIVKETPYDPRVEADGLQALREAGAEVPEVYAAEPHGVGAGGLLVLERVGGAGDWAALGARLAAVHADTGETGAFGWHRDNLIGSLPQRNTPTAHWPTFYAEHRIRPFLGEASLPGSVTDRLAAACEGPLIELLDTDPPTSLVHGDLWSGNVVSGRWLIDPAVHRADREFELAFADVFGGLPQPFWDAYHGAWPLPSGWDQRRPALQLYHLLVHVALFGGGYVPAVTSRLDALGW